MVGIIFIGDLYVCPYLHRYVDACEEQNVKYEVLFWNRCGEAMHVPKNYFYFDFTSAEEQPFIAKLLDFMKYRKWLKGKILDRRYDKLIVLSTLSGMLIADLLKKYAKRYVFDIRDYSYEYFKLFYLIEKKVIHNSNYTAISSPGFKVFLPKFDYLTIHNMQSNETTIRSDFKKKAYGESLNVVWNGTMRYFEHQRRIIDRLSNDSRFTMYYHGDGAELESYLTYAEKNSVKNIFFTGRYSNAKKKDLLVNADILNNSYWIDNEKEVMYALSNRYYDGLIYKIPQLVEVGTYKTALCESNHIGIGLDPRNDGFADELYDWYFTLNSSSFIKTCDTLLLDAVEDDRIVASRLVSFLNE